MISLQLNVQNRQIHRDRKEPGVARGWGWLLGYEASFWGPVLCVPSEEGPCSRGRCTEPASSRYRLSHVSPVWPALLAAQTLEGGVYAFHSVAEKTQAWEMVSEEGGSTSQDPNPFWSSTIRFLPLNSRGSYPQQKGQWARFWDIWAQQQFCHWLAAWLWASHLNSLSLKFPHVWTPVIPAPQVGGPEHKDGSSKRDLPLCQTQGLELANKGFLPLRGSSQSCVTAKDLIYARQLHYQGPNQGIDHKG